VEVGEAAKTSEEGECEDAVADEVLRPVRLSHMVMSVLRRDSMVSGFKGLSEI